MLCNDCKNRYAGCHMPTGVRCKFRMRESAIPFSGLFDADDLQLRESVSKFIMDKFNAVPKTGHFWFDIHDATDLLECINKSVPHRKGKPMNYCDCYAVVGSDGVVIDVGISVLSAIASAERCLGEDWDWMQAEGYKVKNCMGLISNGNLNPTIHMSGCSQYAQCAG